MTEQLLQRAEYGCFRPKSSIHLPTSALASDLVADLGVPLFDLFFVNHWNLPSAALEHEEVSNEPSKTSNMSGEFDLIAGTGFGHCFIEA